MKKTALKNLLYGIIAVISAVFFIASPVLAVTTIRSQTTGTTEVGLGTSIGFPVGTGMTGTLNSVTIKVRSYHDNSGGGPAPSVSISVACWQNNDPAPGCPTSESPTNNWPQASDNTETLPTGDYSVVPHSADYVFSLPIINLNSSRFYSINVASSSSIYIMGVDTNQSADDPEGILNTNIADVDYDPYFYFEHDPFQNDDIYFADPPFREGAITTDFTYWRYCIDGTGASYGSASVVFRYGDSLTEFEDDFEAVDIPYFDGIECHTITKGNALSTGAKAAVIDLYIDGVPEAQSAVWHFTVIDGDTSAYPIDLGGEDDPDLTFECGDGNFLVIGLCKAAVFLFVPGDGSTALANEAYTDLSGTFPFAYVTDVWEAVDGLEEGTASASSLTLDFENTALPLGGTEGIDIFSTETIEGYLGTGQLALFRGLMATAIWVGLGFYVFHRAGGLH